MSRREIFARRAMVDQARECLRFSEKLNILEYLTLKSSSVLLLFFFFFWLVISNVKLGVLLTIYHSNNEIFLLSCLAMESWTVACFAWQGRKGCVTADILAEIAEEKSCTSFREMLSFSCIHIYFPKSRYDCK